MRDTTTRGISTLGLIGVLAIAGLGYIGWAAYQKAQAKAAFSAAVSNSIERMDKSKAQWADAMTIATSTPRIGLAGPVSNLQKIRQEVQAIDVPDCLANSKQHLVKGMNHGVEAMLAFMRNDLPSYALDAVTAEKATLMASEFERYSKKDTVCVFKK